MRALPSVIIFSKSPESPNAKTRLRYTLDHLFVQKLHREMVNSALSLVQKADCGEQYIYWDEPYQNSQELASHFIQKHQVGDSFGERFQHSIQSTFREKEIPGIIIIGSDCPLLTQEILLSAIENIMDGFPVIGPAQNGGFYLLGIPSSKKDCSFLDSFSNGPESQRVCEVLSDTTKTLPFLFDIDEVEDLINFYILYQIKKETELLTYKRVFKDVVLEKEEISQKYFLKIPN